MLALLAELPEGTAATAGSVLARLRWERPLRGPRGAQGSRTDDDLRSRLAQWTLSEAELLGVTGRGALSSHGRALLGLPPRAPAGDDLPAQPGDKLPAHHHQAHHQHTPPEPPAGPPLAPLASLPPLAPLAPPNRPRPPPAPPASSPRCSPNPWTTSSSRRT